MPGAEGPVPAEANRLYWETDLSVGRIAERLGLSRRALYDAIEPLPAEASCGACGGGAGYPNRSARDAGHAVCRVCGASVETSGPAVRREERSPASIAVPDMAADSAPAAGERGSSPSPPLAAARDSTPSPSAAVAVAASHAGETGSGGGPTTIRGGTPWGGIAVAGLVLGIAAGALAVLLRRR